MLAHVIWQSHMTIKKKTRNSSRLQEACIRIWMLCYDSNLQVENYIFERLNGLWLEYSRQLDWQIVLQGQGHMAIVIICLLFWWHKVVNNFCEYKCTIVLFVILYKREITPIN